MRESLLTPSLSPSRAPAAILYSVESSFLLAFFGGPFAIILYSALNSWKLRRPLDGLVYLAALLLSVAFIVAVKTRYAPLAGLMLAIGASAAELLWRALSMVLFALFYLMHRKQHRSAVLFGAKAPSPWIPAIAFAVLAHGMKLGVLYYAKAYLV
ncbi:hypothetical protein F2P44_11640 [Massilia sp. CCM 8695]|uniref:Prepilin type IV endopeptidase peptidase domain-containing protein n=1 Tax=Massilia frigida TaxID=2609281 RepID=A0ABX0N3L6_9BURK|nr:hypothetical protein [Massilia frigida]NHZ79923.1 hypothetical protein [Massilia frigida]